MNIDKELDTRGLNCPLPILKAKKALTDMLSGQLLRVVATDAGSVRDFQAFAKQTGNELVEQQTTATDFIHVLRRRLGRATALQRQALKIAPEGGAHDRVGQCQLYSRLQKTFFAAAVVAFAKVVHGMHAL